MTTELERISKVLRALQCPARQKIIVLLMNKETRSIPEISRITGMSHCLTFQNVRQLQRAGIVIVERKQKYTKRVVYKIRRSNRSYVAAIFDNARHMNTGAIPGGKHKPGMLPDFDPEL